MSSYEFFHNSFLAEHHPLREKCPNTEFFLVRIFLYSDQKKLRIWTLFAQCKVSKFSKSGNQALLSLNILSIDTNLIIMEPNR